ncbi:unnamed protein product [Lactuca saligna]|uniref:Uncharacterized protein n=1 Tax=Lactuca saligna TaxID=75948 RepID=A0AA36A2Z0_LACSI|nr:unnamed protein product [Lactuca saligna]
MVETRDSLLNVSIRQNLFEKLQPIDPKVNEASGSKGKEKIIDDDEEKEEVLLDGEKLIRKNLDKVLDDLLILCKELEAKEAEARVVKVTLANQMSLFPPWTLERIQKEAIEYKIWSLKKLVVVKVYAPFPIEHFKNVKFRGFRGADRKEEDFTLADLPFAKLDVEIAFILRKRPIVNPKEETKNFQKKELGKIKKVDWSVVYQRNEGDKV